MIRRLFVLRPEPGLAATASAARERGFEVTAWPMAQALPVEWSPPAEAAFDGLLIGSGNAVRLAGSDLANCASKPAYCVGQATADAAVAAGLTVAKIGSGGLQGLIDELAGQRLTLLRIAGETHVPLALPAGITVIVRVVYRVAYRPLPELLALQLREGGTVLLHSGEAAKHFAAECDRLDVPRSRLCVAALAPRIAEAAGDGWGAVAAAPEPSDAALLALARDMCQ